MTLANDKERLLKCYEKYYARQKADAKRFENEKVANLNMRQEISDQERETAIEQLKTLNHERERLRFSLGLLLLLIFAGVQFRNIRTQKRLNKKIQHLVNDQELIIEERTNDLQSSNTKLRELISFNAHQIREPLTRITGTFLVREHIEDDEFITE